MRSLFPACAAASNVCSLADKTFNKQQLQQQRDECLLPTSQGSSRPMKHSKQAGHVTSKAMYTKDTTQHTIWLQGLRTVPSYVQAVHLPTNLLHLPPHFEQPAFSLHITCNHQPHDQT
jgi:hypothetical protein